MVASKLPQILQLNPTHELVFQGPFDKVVTSFLELKNPSEQRICFKVKTTAPRRYCVRPNSGIVEPDGKIKIAIMLQPMEPESYNERSKHKFMVQSIIVRREVEAATFDEVWANASSELVMDSKLKCTFIDAGESKSHEQQQQLDTSTPDLIGSIKKTSSAVKQTTSQQYQVSGDGPQQQSSKRSPEQVTTSTPIRSSSSTAIAGGAFKDPTQAAVKSSLSFTPRRSDGQADKSMLSSHNLTSSFHQSMSDDKKIVLVSLIMLILGVILGKYII